MSEVTNTESPESQEKKNNELLKEYKEKLSFKTKTAFIRVGLAGAIIVIVWIIILNVIY